MIFVHRSKFSLFLHLIIGAAVHLVGQPSCFSALILSRYSPDTLIEKKYVVLKTPKTSPPLTQEAEELVTHDR